MNIRQKYHRTFERRGTPFVTVCLFCFTKEFAKSTVKQTQWKAFMRKNTLTLPEDFGLIVGRLSGFLLPVLLDQTPTPIRWNPKDGWRFD